jgi:hypothetical protein
MHMMFMLHPLIHVLMVAVLAFFVLFAASKAEGFVSLLGTVLGWVILLGAAAMLVLGIVCHLTDKCPMEHGDKKVMMWESDGNGPPPAGMMAAPAPQTAPAQPAASPPKP